MRMNSRLVAGLLPPLAVLAFAAPVAAQSADTAAPQPADANQDVIVVTAQFREQNLQNTPIAITAMSSEMLSARGQTDIGQVTAQAPGVNLQPEQGSFGPSLAASMRGVGQYDYSPAVEPGVGFYVDDVYYPSLTGAIFDLLDLDRVEILRGPQGTLAGRNSIGGAIKLYSQKPTDDNSGMVQATYGSRNRMDFRGSFNFGLGNGFSARISGAAKRQDGYVDVYDFGCVNPPGSALNPAVGGVAPTRPAGHCLVDKDSNVNYQAVRGQLRYHPDDRVDIVIAGDYVNDSRRVAGTVITDITGLTSPRVRGAAYNTPYDSRFICGPYCNYETGINPADPAHGVYYDTSAPLTSVYHSYGVSGNADFKLTDNLQLKSITAYRQMHSIFAADTDLSPLPVNGSSVDLSLRFFSQETRLNGSFLDDAVQYTIGGYYSDQKTVLGQVNDFRSSGLQFASLGDTVPASSLAFFGHVSWKITPKLTFNGGVRRTHEEKDYTFSRVKPDGSLGAPLVGSLNGLTGSYRENRWDYRANIQYQWTPDIMTYAQFSTGYKGGGINPRPYFASQVQPFSAESIKAYEIGLKSDLLDRHVRLNLSAYYNKYNNIQLVLTSCPQFTPGNAPAPCAMTANAGDANVKGFEVETTLRPVRGLTIDGSLSYVDFKYTSIAAAAGGPTGVRLTDVAPFSSKWKWSAGIQYEAQLGGGSTLTPRFDMSYQSGFYTAARNVPAAYVPSYALGNARLTWRNAGRDLEISAEVTNVFNRYYFLTVFDQTPTAGVATGQPGRPREWAVTVTKRF